MDNPSPAQPTESHQPAEPRKQYAKIEDPGHGWLVVPLADVREAGFRPSEFSYFMAGVAYLEEDCDMPGFLACLPLQPQIRYEVKDGDADCRWYRRFPASS